MHPYFFKFRALPLITKGLRQKARHFQVNSQMSRTKCTQTLPIPHVVLASQGNARDKQKQKHIISLMKENIVRCLALRETTPKQTKYQCAESRNHTTYGMHMINLAFLS